MESETVNPLIEPIQAEIYGIGGYKNLFRVKDLAEVLLYNFPKEGRGEEYNTALMACLDCMSDGDTLPSEAREAFVAAAHECGVSVLPDDAPKW
jgi:hypothetical protein